MLGCRCPTGAVINNLAFDSEAWQMFLNHTILWSLLYFMSLSVNKNF